MGPWVHGAGEENYAGEVEFDVEAAQDSWDDVRLRWFDRWLKGLDSGVDSEPPVKLYLMGGGEDDGRMTTGDRLLRGGAWRTAQDWPLPETEPTPYYLHASGGLSAAPPAARAPSGYSFDPRYPVPTTGGNISAADPLMPPGGFDQRNRADLHGWLGPDYQHTLPLAARADVLTFQTPPLEEAFEVTGSVVVELWASSSAVDTDFTAKLIDVYPPSPDWPDGFALNLGGQRCAGAVSGGLRPAPLSRTGAADQVLHPAVPDEQPVRARPSYSHRHCQLELPAVRCQPPTPASRSMPIHTTSSPAS